MFVVLSVGGASVCVDILSIVFKEGSELKKGLTCIAVVVSREVLHYHGGSFASDDRLLRRAPWALQ